MRLRRIGIALVTLVMVCRIHICLSENITRGSFPKGFVFGTASSAFQAVLVARLKALIQRKGALDITRKILKRLETHLGAVGQFRASANMRGSSAEEVAERILSQPSLSGLQVVGSGVLVSPLTNIFNEETPRLYKLLKKLGL